MDEHELHVFIDIVSQYFSRQTGREPEIGTPYLGEPAALPVHDLTGVIGISGVRKGCVYFTAPKDMLRNLLLQGGEMDVSDDNLSDMAGEIANTISGNARKHFGGDFLISVPVVVAGCPDSIQMPRTVKAYILPLRWHKHEAVLVVSLQ
ncbi:chemotaxis protein CheX [Chitinilyticum piscinae]|uniref:Chemotaxis protein CheX n=1 Tax=Chitinilyticum piscinae TaxID=2866724 RepID=A0A8J7K7T4_9NEIS|nr:chemotaxis protein CheX [Chitinilyticum piscinae]MBE9608563.1 chemotaxis protein CheX [Chitinilyticum piscinae]